MRAHSWYQKEEARTAHACQTARSGRPSRPACWPGTPQRRGYTCTYQPGRQAGANQGQDARTLHPTEAVPLAEKASAARRHGVADLARAPRPSTLSVVRRRRLRAIRTRRSSCALNSGRPLFCPRARFRGGWPTSLVSTQPQSERDGATANLATAVVAGAAGFQCVVHRRCRTGRIGCCAHRRCRCCSARCRCHAHAHVLGLDRHLAAPPARHARRRRRRLIRGHDIVMARGGARHTVLRTSWP
jgi:hypothetical protein